MPWICLRKDESVSRIARENGHDPAAIWNLPVNRDVRSCIPSMDEESIGTTIYIPRVKPKTLKGQTGQRQSITIKNSWQVICPYCGKPRAKSTQGGDYCQLKPDGTPGNNIGNGTKLRERIWGTNGHFDHPWWVGPGSLQAHHLICSEVLAEPDWAVRCNDFGYDINCGMNGFMLPYRMLLACFLAVPLHRGNHAKTKPKYSVKVEEETMRIINKLENGKYCNANGPAAFRDDINAASNKITKKIETFEWTITFDGKDYSPFSNIGCAASSSFPDKRSKPQGHSCTANISYSPANGCITHDKGRWHGDRPQINQRTKVVLKGFREEGLISFRSLEPNDNHVKKGIL